MTDSALEQLDRLRAQAVEQRRVELARALSAASEPAARLRLARASVLAAEQALQRAAERNQPLSSIRALQAGADHLALLRAQANEARVVLSRAEQVHAGASAQVRAAEQALRDAECARLGTKRVLARRAQAVSLRTERLREDELDELFHASNSW